MEGNRNYTFEPNLKLCGMQTMAQSDLFSDEQRPNIYALLKDLSSSAAQWKHHTGSHDVYDSSVTVVRLPRSPAAFALKFLHSWAHPLHYNVQGDTRLLASQVQRTWRTTQKTQGMMRDVHTMATVDLQHIVNQLGSIQEQQRNLHTAIVLGRGSQNFATPMNQQPPEKFGRVVIAPPSRQDLLAEKLSSWGRKTCQITVCCSNRSMLAYC
jgi:hypothetical protein